MQLFISVFIIFFVGGVLHKIINSFKIRTNDKTLESLIDEYILKFKEKHPNISSTSGEISENILNDFFGPIMYFLGNEELNSISKADKNKMIFALTWFQICYFIISEEVLQTMVTRLNDTKDNFNESIKSEISYSIVILGSQAISSLREGPNRFTDNVKMHKHLNGCYQVVLRLLSNDITAILLNYKDLILAKEVLIVNGIKKK